MEETILIRKKGSKHIHLVVKNSIDPKRLNKDGDILIVSQKEYEEYRNSIPIVKKEEKVEEKVEVDRMPEIVTAIGTLNPEEDYTKPNPMKPSCPTVGALSKAVGFDINGTQRDEAWKIYQETKPVTDKEIS
jgi:hypothetical protein